MPHGHASPVAPGHRNRPTFGTRQAISRWIEDRTGWSIRKFVRTARRYRTIEIQAGNRTITAADPLPDDLRHALERSPEPADTRTNVANLGKVPQLPLRSRSRKTPSRNIAASAPSSSPRRVRTS